MRSRASSSARDYDAALRAVTRDGKSLPAEKARTLDAILMKAESALTRPKGLPGRSWYRHQVYARGQYTGYGVKTLPGAREAIELRRWSEAEQQIAIVAGALTGFAELVQRATSALK